MSLLKTLVGSLRSMFSRLLSRGTWRASSQGREPELAPVATFPGVLWEITPLSLCGSCYLLIEPAYPASQETEEVAPFRDQESRDLARMHWDRFKAYWRLTPIFREMRRERARDPRLVEFFAYLQFPPSYNWRRPSADERMQIERWDAGLDDARPREPLYLRTKWLADRAAARRVEVERWTWVEEKVLRGLLRGPRT